MTLFTRLTKQLAQLEDRLTALEDDPATKEAVLRNVGSDELAELAPKLGHAVEGMNQIRSEFTSAEPSVAKLKAKALLSGDARLYNEKKSAEILAFCARFESFGTRLEDLELTLRPVWKGINEQKAQDEAVRTEREQHERHRREQLELEARAAAVAAAEEADRQEREAKEKAAQAAADAQAESRRQYEEKQAAKTAAKQAAIATAEAEAAARAEHIASQAAAQLEELNTVKSGAREERLPGTQTESNTFKIKAQVVGESSPRTVDVEQGDGATVAELKALLVEKEPDLASHNLIVFAGGRELKDEWSLRRCRLRSNAVVQIGMKKN